MLESLPPPAPTPKARASSADDDEARRSFRAFVRQAWPIVEPAPLVWGWHLDAICDHLEAVARGEILRLLINEPPGHGKSLIFSVLWPAWLWIDRPSWRSIFASYAADLATRDSLRCRTVVESEWYQERFALPDGWGLRRDQNAKDYFVTTRAGFRYSTSVGGGGTGHRGDLVGIDDPLNAIDAYSKAARTEAIRWLGQTMSTRFNDQATGRMVVIMQRLHEEDPAGWLLAGGGWEHLCLPSEFEPERRAVTFHVVAPDAVVTTTPAVTSGNGHRDTKPANGRRARNGNGKMNGSRAGVNGSAAGVNGTGDHVNADGTVRREFWRDPRTTAGELLFPAKFPRAVLDAAKAANALGEEGYAGQHQQRPTKPGGNIFKIADWRFYKPDGAAADEQHPRPAGCYTGPARPLPDDVDELLISVDATFKRTTDGSFVAIHVWGAHGVGDRYLLERVHDRMDFDETVRALLGVIRRWPDARRKIIEAKANGDAIISTLTNRYGIAGIEPENPGTENKETRARAMLPYHRSGNVFLPDGAPWLDEYIGEHAAFPLGRFNDDVDAQSQALKHLERPETVATQWARLGKDANAWD